MASEGAQTDAERLSSLSLYDRSRCVSSKEKSVHDKGGLFGTVTTFLYLKNKIWPKAQPITTVFP
jgi:hypothetical protein